MNGHDWFLENQIKGWQCMWQKIRLAQKKRWLKNQIIIEITWFLEEKDYFELKINFNLKGGVTWQ